MKETICTAFGLVGSLIVALFGGWDSALATLLIFMGVDYVTGLMVAATASGVKSGSFTAIGMKRTAEKIWKMSRLRLRRTAIPNRYRHR